MQENLEKNKTIAKNTLLLYVRMFVLMLVGLYTSRIVLGALGEEDYGIYNVIGGTVAMFTVVTGALVSAIMRFLNNAKGSGDVNKLKQVFLTALAIQLILTIVFIAVMEPIGLWFIEKKMVLDPSRIQAAKWVLQFSLLSYAINLLGIPYYALIITNEKMGAFAFSGLIEGFGKLAVAFLILRSPIDRLVFYASLMAVVTLIVRLIYALYCRKNFDECRVSLRLDKNLFKEMLSFAGWNFIGSTAGILREHGGNILINIFSTSPAVNAARGIAVQLNGAVQNFVSNFMTALSPQIMKSYAAGDVEYMSYLAKKGGRFAFYLLLLISLPIMFNTHYLIDIWLGKVMDHTVLFAQLFLIFAMSESLITPLNYAVAATGHVKWQQIIVGGLQLLNIPISYVLLRAGHIPEVVNIVSIVLSQFSLFATLFILKYYCGFSVFSYIKTVYLNVLIVTLLAILPPLLTKQFMPEGFLGFLINTLICLASTVFVVWFVGVNKGERTAIKTTLLSKFKRK